MFAELLRARLAGIAELSETQIAALEAHYRLMVRWNKVLNLTRITRLIDVIERHYCESLFLGEQLPPGALRIMDIGSGAGFPGFPVAVRREDCVVFLVESNHRKATFLREACRGIKNLYVLSERAEVVSSEFDHVISRALTYDQTIPIAKRLARRIDLLTGKELPSEDFGLTWQSTKLPWGNKRYHRTAEWGHL